MLCTLYAGLIFMKSTGPSALKHELSCISNEREQMDKWNTIPTKNGEFQCRASLLNERKMNLQSHIKFKVPSPPPHTTYDFLFKWRTNSEIFN